MEIWCAALRNINDELAAGGLATIFLTSDDPDDLTLRQARWICEADTVLHDAGVPDAILARARADAVRGPSDGTPRGRTVVIRSRE